MAVQRNRGRTMKRIKVVLCLVAMLAFSGMVGASAAQAKKNIPKGAIKFTSVSKGKIMLAQESPGVQVDCETGKSEGEITGPKAGTVTVILEGCTAGGEKCNGGASIATNQLKTELGTIKPSEVAEFLGFPGNVGTAMR